MFITKGEKGSEIQLQNEIEKTQTRNELMLQNDSFMVAQLSNPVKT